MYCKSTDPFLSKRQASLIGTNSRSSLNLAMIVRRYKPDILDSLEAHTRPVVFNNDTWVVLSKIIEIDIYSIRICVVCILDQLKDSESWATNKLVAEKSQDARTGT